MCESFNSSDIIITCSGAFIWMKYTYHTWLVTLMVCDNLKNKGKLVTPFNTLCIILSFFVLC